MQFTKSFSNGVFVHRYSNTQKGYDVAKYYLVSTD